MDHPVKCCLSRCLSADAADVYDGGGKAATRSCDFAIRTTRGEGEKGPIGHGYDDLPNNRYSVILEISFLLIK